MVMEYQSEEEILKGQGIDPITGDPIQLSGAPTTPDSGHPATQVATPQARESAGTGFTSITQYLEQNKPQSAKLAGQVGSLVEDKGRAAREAIDQTQELFNEQSKPTGVDQNVLDSAINNTSDFVQDPDKLDAFFNMRDAEYNGPSSLDEVKGYQPLLNTIEDAQNAAKGTTTEEGQRALLTEMTTSPNVTHGMTSLNQLLLANPTARETLAKSKEGLSDIGARLQEAADAATARAEANRLATTETRETTGDAINQAYIDFQNRIDQQTQAEINRANNEIAAYKRIFQTGQMPQTLPGPNIKPGEGYAGVEPLQSYPLVNPDHLGIQMSSLQDILAKNAALPPEYRVDLSAYLQTQNPGAIINRGNIANEADYSRLAALNQLAGNPQNYGATPYFLPQEYTGGYNPDFVNLDSIGLQNEMMGQYRNYLNQLDTDYQTAQAERPEPGFGEGNVTFGSSAQQFQQNSPLPGWENVDINQNTWI